MIIYRVVDKSYVVEKNGMPYHVPKTDEYMDAWEKIHAYVLEHPDELVVEEPVVHTPTEAEIQQVFINAIQKRLDSFAQTRGYDDIKSAIGAYSDSHIPQFKNEASYLRWALSETWAVANKILGNVVAGNRTIPASIDEILPELPKLEWPQ